MNRVTLSGKHKPCIKRDIIGCDGYINKTDCIYCLIVNKDGNFLKDGIIENSVVFVDSSIPYEEDKLNVFVTDAGIFQISTTKPLCNDYSGRVIMALNQYD